MSERDIALWQCNQTKHAHNYQRIGPRQFCVVLCYRLGIPLFEEGELCSSCDREMDIFSDHALHCSHEIGLKFRHDIVLDSFVDMCYRAGVPARKEVDLGLLPDSGLALRPADILVYNWDSDVCLDVTGVSPFTGGRVHTFVRGQAISKAVTRKHNKYLEKCSAQGLGFAVLAFTTLGDLGGDTIDFLKRLRNYIASHDANVKVGDFLFHGLEVVIQKGIGAQNVKVGDFLFHRLEVVIQKGIGAQLVVRLLVHSDNEID